MASSYLDRALAACRLPIRVTVGPAGVYYLHCLGRWNFVYQDHDAARTLYVATRDALLKEIK